MHASHVNVCDLEHGCAVDQLLAKYDDREDELTDNLRQTYEPSDGYPAPGGTGPVAFLDVSYPGASLVRISSFWTLHR